MSLSHAPMFTDQIDIEFFIRDELLSQGVALTTAASIADWIRYLCEMKEGRLTQGPIIVSIDPFPSSGPCPSKEGASTVLQVVKVTDDVGVIGSLVAQPIYQPIAPHLLTQSADQHQAA